MKKFLLLILIVQLVTSCQPNEEWTYPAIFWGFVVEGFPITDQMLDSQLAETNVHPEMIVFFLQWQVEDSQNELLIPSLETIWNRGAVPCLTWEPMRIHHQKEITIPYQEILDGKYDSYLSSIANKIKLWGKPLVIRFAHEMNLSRYHWGTDLDNYGPKSPEIYKKMFRYVVEFFRKNGVKNAFWAFSPNAESLPNELWNVATNYYPGDEYVNLLGMDGYNWGIKTDIEEKEKSAWKGAFLSFEQIFRPLFKKLKKIAPQKPIIVFETASVNPSNGKKKSQWIREALKTAKRWGIKGIVWFQVEKEEDWKLGEIESEMLRLHLKNHTPSLQEWLKQ